jgi:hypothetical protein
MPPKPGRHNPDRTATITIRIPGHIKNQITQQAKTNGLSINSWTLAAIKTAINHGLQTPAPQAPIVTVETVINDYLHGKQTIAPCGKPWPCEGANNTEDLKGSTWCSNCGIRFS